MEDTKTRILIQAHHLFLKYGIKNITMDCISECLGISKRTIYKHFLDKNELLRQSITSYLNKRDKTVATQIKNSTTVIEAIIRLIRLGMIDLEKINPLFFQDLKKYYPDILAYIEKENEPFNRKLIIKFLKQGIKQNLFREDIDLELVAAIVIGQLQNIRNEELFPREKFSKKQILLHMMINYLRGISKPKGIELLEKNKEIFINDLI